MSDTEVSEEIFRIEERPTLEDRATLEDSATRIDPTTDLLAKLFHEMHEARSRDEDRRRREEEAREKRWQDFIGSFTGATSLTVPAVPIESATTAERDIPKFRRLDTVGEEDVEAYFSAFEMHMDCYGVPKIRWGRHLGPILNPDASEVYLALNSDERKDYDTLRKALFSHYNVNKDTYRLKIDKLKRKHGETWTVCGKRYRCLVKKWFEGCTDSQYLGTLLGAKSECTSVTWFWT